MYKPRCLLNKTLVLGIVFLFIGMSVVFSTGNIAENHTLNKNIIETFNSLKDKFICEHPGYVLSSGTNCNIYEFLLNDPVNLTCVCEGELLMSGATWSNDGYMYSSQYSTAILLKIDMESCEMSSIGGGGTSMIGLAYDYFIEKIYASSGDYLYKIDPNTGEQDEIGPFGNGIMSMVGMASDAKRTLYGWDLGMDKLWTIDTNTGQATEVGSLGIDLIYACDGDFCKKDDILYIAHENNLLMCDKDTGECELSDQFSDNVTVTGLAIPYDYNDVIPPVSTHSLNPLEPDGNNGWYVGDVNVTLTATDDNSGVKEIRYTINKGADQLIIGDNGSFILEEEGDDILIEYWATDIAGNVETKNNFLIDIDQTVPEISLTYEVIGGNRLTGWFFEFTACAVDEISGMDYVEFYLNGEIMATIHGPGPDYTWIYHWPGLSDTKFRVRGFICNLEITDEYVDFYALMVKISNDHLEEYDFIACGYDNAGNRDCDGLVQPTLPLDTIYPGFYLFRKFTLPNNYTGYIGRLFIYATFIYD
jgi:hypothetical protein